MKKMKNNKKKSQERKRKKPEIKRKEKGFSEKIKGFLELARPIEWSKSLQNMLIAIVIAHVLFNLTINWTVFLIGFLAVGLLWGALYTFNDFVDAELDAQHPVKKKRAIPSGKVKRKEALVFGIVLCIISFILAGFVLENLNLIIVMLLMFLNQWLYSNKPFNLKKKPIVDLISGSMINPVLRFYAGWFLAAPFFYLPIEALLFVVFVQFGGYGIYRLSSARLEKKKAFSSSVALFGEKTRYLFYLGILIGAIGYILMCLNLLKNNLFLYWGVVQLFALPLYFPMLKKGKEEDIKKYYPLLYGQNIIFIIGFLIIAFWL